MHTYSLLTQYWLAYLILKNGLRICQIFEIHIIHKKSSKMYNFYDFWIENMIFEKKYKYFYKWQLTDN